MIRVPQVRVVDEEGAQLGVMPTQRALEMAQERGYDLVEVAPMASPPVVKFLDFGQYKYELTKRDKEAKRRQRAVTFKEVRLTPKIGSGDFDTKVHRAIEFLEDGDRIKVTVRFRGRELTHPELGRNMLAKFTERIKEHGTPERAPLLEGKSMHITVASLHKPKEHEAPQRHGKGAAATAAEPAAAEPAVAEPAAAEPAVAATPAAATNGEATEEPAPAPAQRQPAPTAPKAPPARTADAAEPAPAATGE
jgi:translation initiation factor IF-3